MCGCKNNQLKPTITGVNETRNIRPRGNGREHKKDRGTISALREFRVVGMGNTSNMAKLTLIDKYLPEYTFNEYHYIEVNRSVADVYNSAKDFDMSQSKLINVLFKIRGLPSKRMNLQGFISDIGFTNIEERFPTENLIGFWARTKIEPISGYRDFIENTISARVKVVWNFRFEEINGGQTKLSTKTRIWCVTPLSKITFGLYWRIIKPFSGVIRKRMLQIIKDDAESAESIMKN